MHDYYDNRILNRKGKAEQKQTMIRVNELETKKPVKEATMKSARKRRIVE